MLFIFFNSPPNMRWVFLSLRWRHHRVTWRRRRRRRYRSRPFIGWPWGAVIMVQELSWMYAMVRGGWWVGEVSSLYGVGGKKCGERKGLTPPKGVTFHWKVTPQWTLKTYLAITSYNLTASSANRIGSISSRVMCETVPVPSVWQYRRLWRSVLAVSWGSSVSLPWSLHDHVVSHVHGTGLTTF